jgi:monoterpene epsilon-lactone hydrolase
MIGLRARAIRALIRSGVKSVRELPLAVRRARVESLVSRTLPPIGTAVTPVTAGGVRGEWVRSRTSVEDRTLLYLHGGAFCLGSPATHRNLVARICLYGRARAFSLEYRLAPEHPFPAALEDALAAWQFLRASGAAASRIALVGDSAGANIALAALLSLRDAGETLPAAVVCISAPTDFTAGSESLTSRAELDPMLRLDAIIPLCRAYTGDTRPDDPRVSPLLADLHGLPPLLLHVGSDEILHDDSVRFAAKARAAGVEVTLEIGEGLWHVWHAAAPWVPEATAALRRIGSYLRERMP